MGWQGPYYYRSVRQNGKPRREYIGRGPLAELIADEDRERASAREADRKAENALRAEFETIEVLADELDELADLASAAALVNAGFRQHHRSEWRKSRGRSPAMSAFRCRDSSACRFFSFTASVANFGTIRG